MNAIEHVRNDSNSGSVGNCVNTASIWLILWEMHFQGGVDTCISSWRSSGERERETGEKWRSFSRRPNDYGWDQVQHVLASSMPEFRMLTINHETKIIMQCVHFVRVNVVHYTQTFDQVLCTHSIQCVQCLRSIIFS